MRTVTHLRRSFPREVTAETLRKLGVAPKNESYVINILRFLGVLDDEGHKVEDKARAFVQHQDAAFSTEFGALVKHAYEELFELHGDTAWELDKNALTQFFRTSDHSSGVVGARQATTFMALAGLAGHGSEADSAREAAPPRVSKPPRGNAARGRGRVERGFVDEQTGPPTMTTPEPTLSMDQSSQRVGLTVRIEVNLPANGDQETYDRIFRSIRKNLIDGESA
jgi:hypothetical protein